jgi:hypothetical protein
MKKHILICVLSMLELYGATPVTSPSITVATIQPNQDKELEWVDEQILAILPSRVGVPDGFINSLHDPMKMKQSPPMLKVSSNLLAPPKLGSVMGALLQPKIIVEPLRLLAIMNKSVLISGKWYKLGQSVRDFTLVEIKSNSVLLTGRKDQNLILFLNKQNNNIKIITK